MHLKISVHRGPVVGIDVPDAERTLREVDIHTLRRALRHRHLGKVLQLTRRLPGSRRVRDVHLADDASMSDGKKQAPMMSNHTG